MASYGIGPARIVAAAVEQFADEHGISWPRALAPFAVHLVALGKPGTPERDAADEVYRRLLDGGVEVLYDDRDLGPGEKFAEAELLGCPLRLTVGRRSLESGEIEVQVRRGREQAPGLPLDAEPRGARAGGARAVAEPPVGLRGRGRGRRALPARAPPRRRPAGRRPPSGRLAPARARPLGPAAARHAAAASRCGRGRSPTRSASCGSR